MITVYHPDERVEVVPRAVAAECSSLEVRVFGPEAELLGTFPPDVAVRFSEDEEPLAEKLRRVVEETKIQRGWCHEAGGPTMEVRQS